MRHLTLGTRAAESVVRNAPTGGVDFSTAPHRLDENHLADALNLWVRDGHVTTRPAVIKTDMPFHTGATLTAQSLGRQAFLHGQKGDLHFFGLVDEQGLVAGEEHEMAGVDVVTAVPQSRDGAALLFMDGENYGAYTLYLDGSIEEVTPTVPTLLIAARPTVARLREETGALFEAPNLLGEQFRCRYTADGTGLYYWLPEGVHPDMDAPFSVSYTALDGGKLTHTVTAKNGSLFYEENALVDSLCLCYNASEGCFWFRHAHGDTAAPLQPTDLILEASLPSRRKAVCGMRIGTWYGSRLFLAGDEEEGHLLRWSAAGDAFYFPENNYAFVGASDEPITALAKQSDLLVIFKRSAVYAARPVIGTVTSEDLLSGASVDVEAATAFPVSLVHPAFGCDLPQTVCLPNDRLVWACTDGKVYTLVSGGSYSTRSVREVSVPIEAALTPYAYGDWQKASAAVHDGYYLLSIGGTTYVLSDEETWHIWELPPSQLVTARRRALLITDLAVHRFEEHGDDYADGMEGPIACRMVTRYDELGDPLTMKRLQTLTVWMTGASEVNACVAINDREVRSVQFQGLPLEKVPPLVVPLGGRRVRHVGITVETTGRMTLDRFAMEYRRTGEVTE